MHYRLAALVGTLDVDGLMDSVAPELVDGWIAYDRIEPLHQRRLEQTLASTGSAVCASNGMEIDPQLLIHGDKKSKDSTPRQASKEFGERLRKAQGR